LNFGDSQQNSILLTVTEIRNKTRNSRILLTVTEISAYFSGGAFMRLRAGRPRVLPEARIDMKPGIQGL
jgi:hypothetical protein